MSIWFFLTQALLTVLFHLLALSVLPVQTVSSLMSYLGIPRVQPGSYSDAGEITTWEDRDGPGPGFLMAGCAHGLGGPWLRELVAAGTHSS